MNLTRGEIVTVSLTAITMLGGAALYIGRLDGRLNETVSNGTILRQEISALQQSQMVIFEKIQESKNKVITEIEKAEQDAIKEVGQKTQESEKIIKGIENNFEKTASDYQRELDNKVTTYLKEIAGLGNNEYQPRMQAIINEFTKMQEDMRKQQEDLRIRQQEIDGQKKELARLSQEDMKNRRNDIDRQKQELAKLSDTLKQEIKSEVNRQKEPIDSDLSSKIKKEENTCYLGHDYNGEGTAVREMQECIDKCSGDPICKVYTFSKNKCWLKNSIPNDRINNNRCTSGIKTENSLSSYKISNSSEVTMRSKPDSNSSEVGKIPSGAREIMIAGEITQMEQQKWMLVEYNGERGWVSFDLSIK